MPSRAGRIDPSEAVRRVPTAGLFLVWLRSGHQGRRGPRRRSGVAAGALTFRATPDPALTEPPSPDTATPRRTVDVLGVHFDALTIPEAVHRLVTLASGTGSHLVLTPNVDHVLRARRDPAFAALCASGSLVIADGQPIVWAARLLGRPLPERVAGSDVMPRSVVAAARAGLRYYFLGGNPGDAARAAAILAAEAGRDGLCGVDVPPFGFEHDAEYLAGLIGRIRAARPQIVYVGLGSPKQEFVMQRLQAATGVPVFMAVGVTFSFVAGTVRRAPRLLRRVGLEWLWRLLCEPRRLWRRYAQNLAVFPWLVLRERLRRPRAR